MWKRIVGIALIALCVFLWLGYPFMQLRMHLALSTLDTPNTPIRALYWPAVLLLTTLFLCLFALGRISVFHPLDMLPMFIAGAALLLHSRIAFFSHLSMGGFFSRQFRVISSLALALGLASGLSSGALWLMKKNSAPLRWKRALLLLAVMVACYCLDQIEFLLPPSAIRNPALGMAWTIVFRYLYPAVVGALLFILFGWRPWQGANRPLGLVFLAVLAFYLLYALTPIGSLLNFPMFAAPSSDSYAYLNGVFFVAGIRALWEGGGSSSLSASGSASSNP